MNAIRTPLFLMANLGSEMMRVYSQKEKGQRELSRQSRERARMITAQMRTLPEMRSRVAELEILEQILNDVCEETPTLAVTQQKMHSYFQPFIERFMRSQRA